MAVPLFDEDKVYGILYSDTGNPLHRYNDDHLRLMATFGNIIGARMLNYTLLEERQEKQVINYYYKNGNFIFASELKSIIETGIKKRINFQSLKNLLKFKFVSGKNSICH